MCRFESDKGCLAKAMQNKEKEKVKMKSNCNKCIHKEMCKYRDGIKSEEILAKIQTEYPFVTDIDFGCRYFEKKAVIKTAEPVKEAKAVVNTDKPASDNDVQSLDDIRVSDFGFDSDVTEQLIALGGMGNDLTIRKLSSLADKMPTDLKKKVNGRLSAFHRSI